MEPDTAEATTVRALLDYLRRPDYRPMPQAELLQRTGVPSQDRPAVRRLIRGLIRQGRIRRLRGGRLAATPDAAAAVRPAERRPGRSRGERELLGLLVRRGRELVVQPFDPTVGEALRVAPGARRGAEPLHVVRIEVSRPRAGQPAEGRVLDDLGHVDAPGVEVEVLAGKHGLRRVFPEEVLDEARTLGDAADRSALARRQRFDDPPPVTIDGETARDFDDAIAVRETARGYRLFVHIADVAHYVAPGSALDVEARERGTSVYFPGSVIPMLPERLSNDLCSLRPREDRLVQSVIIDFTRTGKLSRARFADGVIRSAARLTYREVAAVLDDGGRRAGLPAPLVAMLHAADRLRELVERRRDERGAIDFDLPEPQILLDVEGAMTGITIEPRNRAHRMIETFMIVANEVVAEHLAERGIAAIFRVHDAPDPAKLDALERFVAGFGMRLADERAPGSTAIQRLLEQAEGRPEAPVITQMTLRAMQQARYSGENRGHFALASPAYCHFTSPIRRYPDLVVHRQLRAARTGAAGVPHDAGTLGAIASGSSTLERNAEAAERGALLWKKVAFIAGHVGESFAGVVTGVARFGLFVELVESLVEGLLRVEALGREWFEFDEARFELRGASSGRTFRLGDRLAVRVDRVDRALLRVDLSLAAAHAQPAGRPRRRPAERRRSRRPPRRKR